MTDTVAGPTIADLPRFLPYIRRLVRRFGLGLSIDADDFVQEVCLRAIRFPADCANDDLYRLRLYCIARTVGYHQRQYDHRSKRYGQIYSIDYDRTGSRSECSSEDDYDGPNASDLLPPISGGQYEHTLLRELRRNGRACLQTRQIKGRALDDIWELLWMSAAGKYDQRYRTRLFVARKALREDFSL